jgi:hypothetical protein
MTSDVGVADRPLSEVGLLATKTLLFRGRIAGTLPPKERALVHRDGQPRLTASYVLSSYNFYTTLQSSIDLPEDRNDLCLHCPWLYVLKSDARAKVAFFPSRSMPSQHRNDSHLSKPSITLVYIIRLDVGNQIRFC